MQMLRRLGDRASELSNLEILKVPNSKSSKGKGGEIYHGIKYISFSKKPVDILKKTNAKSLGLSNDEILKVTVL